LVLAYNSIREFVQEIVALVETFSWHRAKFLDCFVVHKPTGMDVLHERGNLLLTGIHPILVGSKHTGITCPYNDIFFLITPWEYDKGAGAPVPDLATGDFSLRPRALQDKDLTVV